MHCDEKFVVDYVKSTGSFALWRSSLISSLQEQGILELLRNKVLTFLKESDVLEPFEQSAKPPPDSDILYNKLLRAIQRSNIMQECEEQIKRVFRESNGLQNEIRNAIREAIAEQKNPKKKRKMKIEDTNSDPNKSNSKFVGEENQRETSRNNYHSPDLKKEPNIKREAQRRNSLQQPARDSVLNTRDTEEKRDEEKSEDREKGDRDERRVRVPSQTLRDDSQRKRLQLTEAHKEILSTHNVPSQHSHSLPTSTSKLLPSPRTSPSTETQKNKVLRTEANVSLSTKDTSQHTEHRTHKVSRSDSEKTSVGVFSTFTGHIRRRRRESDVKPTDQTRPTKKRLISDSPSPSSSESDYSESESRGNGDSFSENATPSLRQSCKDEIQNGRSSAPIRPQPRTQLQRQQRPQPQISTQDPSDSQSAQLPDQISLSQSHAENENLLDESGNESGPA
jgi:hypothetical protein